jgi:diguanylate cyclase (GGDEF)-like protein
VANAEKHVQQRHAARLMDQYADDAKVAVTSEAARYRDTLSDIAAAVGAQAYCTAADFSQITSRLNRQRLSGASGVLFAVPARDGQVAGVQSFWRARGVPGLRLVPVGTGVEHAFVVFNQALDGGVSVPGRDVTRAAEPAQVLRTSRDSGEVAASPTYVLLKDRALPRNQQQMSFLLSAPVYGGTGTPDAGQFRGWILMGMRGGDFIDATLRAESRGSVGVTLIDATGGKSVVVATSSDRTPSQADSLNRQRTVIVGQRDWRLLVYPTHALLTASDRRMSSVVLAVGVLLTLLLTALIGVLVGARNRAMAKVSRATAALHDDIARRVETEARLRDREGELQLLAFHDPLTGLANRTLFRERVEHALITHDRSEQTLAVLFIDLDGFKQVNDSLGHQVGDVVLTAVANRLLDCVRASDTVARLGGDEFAILAEQLTSSEQAESIGDRVVGALQAPLHANGQLARITGSVGVALRQPSHHAAEDLLHSADEAMYAAKMAGKSRYVLAAPTLV